MPSYNNSINNSSYSFGTTAGLTCGNTFIVTAGGATITAGGLGITAGGLTVTAGSTTLTPLAGTNGGVVLSSTAGVISHVENPTTNGQLLISASSGANPIWASLSAGTGISITPGANSISIAATASGIAISEVTADTQLVINTGYIANKAGTATALTLPATAVVGSIIEIIGKGATGWTIVQAASQLIHLGSATTITGSTGHLDSSNAYDCVSLVCIVADTTWTVRNSVGNLTLA